MGSPTQGRGSPGVGPVVVLGTRTIPRVTRTAAERFTVTPKRGAAGQIGKWRVEVVDRQSDVRLDTRTMRAAEAIAALLNDQRVDSAGGDDRPSYEALPQADGWLVVRIERRSSAKEIARSRDEALAVRVASLLTRHAPVLEAPRRSAMRLGMPARPRD